MKTYEEELNEYRKVCRDASGNGSDRLWDAFSAIYPEFQAALAKQDIVKIGEFVTKMTVRPKNDGEKLGDALEAFKKTVSAKGAEHSDSIAALRKVQELAEAIVRKAKAN